MSLTIAAHAVNFVAVRIHALPTGANLYRILGLKDAEDRSACACVVWKIRSVSI